MDDVLAFSLRPPRLGDIESRAEGLLYRRGVEADIPGIIALWELAGWGPVDALSFRRRWFEGPIGPALVIVIEDESGALVGSRITDFKPAILFDEVEIVRRGHAVVLAERFRRRSRDQRDVRVNDPAQLMQKLSHESLAESGIRVGLSVPNPSLLGRPKFTSTARLSRSLKGLKLTLVDVALRPPPLDVTPVPFFHAGYDRLWQRGVRNMGISCAIVRSSLWLNHLREGDLKLECRSRASGELVGYAALKLTDVWKMNDVFAVDADALQAVITSVIMWLKSAGERGEVEDVDRPTSGLSAIDHESYGPSLRDLGAVETEWEFRVQVNTGTPDVQLGPEHEPERWFITMGD